MTKCSVCSSETFTHRAHIKQRASFKENENDLLFNILPICARCHLIFDSPNHGFTINQEWGCCDDRALGMHVTPGGDVFITGTFWSSYKLGVNGAPGTISVTGNQLNDHDNSLLGRPYL